MSPFVRRGDIITSHKQKIIQIHPCLLKLSRKQESVTDGRTDRQTDRQTYGRYYYIPHRYRGGIKTLYQREMHAQEKTEFYSGNLRSHGK
jgi:hypothetical protein